MRKPTKNHASQARVTHHMARGDWSTKHNDRSFNLSNAKHIDSNRQGLNRFWQWDKGMTSSPDFAACERKFYDLCADGLAARNARYIKSGHAEDAKTMDQYMAMKRNRPEEVLLYLGDRSHTIDPALLWNVIREQVQWERDRWPQRHLLDLAMHCDEEGAPHVHVRWLYLAHDKDGNAVVGQNAALREMGVQRPDESRPESRYNNAKQTLTRECREHLQQIAMDRGLDIALDAQPAHMTGQSLSQYKAAQETATTQKIAQQAIEDANNQQQGPLDRLLRRTQPTDLIMEQSRALAIREQNLAAREQSLMTEKRILDRDRAKMEAEIVSRTAERVAAMEQQIAAREKELAEEIGRARYRQEQFRFKLSRLDDICRRYMTQIAERKVIDLVTEYIQENFPNPEKITRDYMQPALDAVLGEIESDWPPAAYPQARRDIEDELEL